MTDSPPRRWHRALAANLSWLLASNGLMAALSLVYVGILTRALGIADFGRFALITGAAQLLSVLVGFETWKLVVQYGLALDAERDETALARLLKVAMLAELAGAAVGIAAILLLFTLWPAPFRLGPDLRPYAIGFVIAQLLAMRSTPTGILRLKDRYGAGALAESAQPVGRLVGVLIALAVWPTIGGFLVAYAVAELLAAFLCWRLALRSIDLRLLWRTPFDWAATARRNAGLARFMWSMNIQSSLGLASRQLPLLAVGGYDGAATAGAFRLALQLANALSKLATLVMRAAFPEIVRSIGAVSRERLQRLIGRILIAGLASAALVFLIVALSGRSLLALLGGGDDYGSGYIFLLWLASAACIEIAAAAFEPILLSLHRAGSLILARVAAVLLQLLAMLALLPAYGAWGASVSVLLGASLSALFLGITLMRQARSPGQS